ncbi:MAG: DUF885 domain-containing protein [Bacteroidetes bacterium]|nr:DUF885 domain-containing protein [Bacteroidota bacterium]MBV6461677.1 hypothetical protein [Flavobacteriales bacterium]WKZ74157.1 MAG: DUF885 domain-containing protein [Vicingaceae bacterium]MCL4816828.1 DUF885 family protein [Flavobacteriales bacterium]NOG95766.1 DUF885 domain-containing protein [Bacteroidota bacterium]
MYKRCLLAVLLFLALSETNAQLPSQLAETDKKFNVFKQDFVDSLWVYYPAWATYSGYHVYDDVLQIPNENTRKKQEQYIHRTLKKMEVFDMTLLSNQNRIDFYMIRDECNAILWSNSELKEHTWNAASYNLGGLINEILSYKDYSLTKRIENISRWLKNVPAYYEAAKINLKDPVYEYAKLATEQSGGVLAMFDAITDSVKFSSVSAQHSNAIHKEIASAKKAAEAFYKWVESELIPLSSGVDSRTFRLGKNLYEKKFAHSIHSEYSASEIYQKALMRKDELHYKMSKIAIELWPKYFGEQLKPLDEMVIVRKVLEAISKNHVHRDSFIVSIKKQIPELETFVKEKNLLFLDPNKPLIVRETPEYMRGVAGASISAPGPYNPNAETYYNVTPLTHYTETQAESYLREYNHYVLQILNIHEAIPGHYTQLVYSNKAPSIIKSLFGNGAMVEGWAVYTELMMLENGYGNNEPEMWLMYYKWHLRSVCNTILDYHVHVLNMPEKDGIYFLTSQAFQEETEAKGKWKRATLSSVQLCSYYTGYYEIYALREELKKKMGNQFNLKQFHEDFLSYGSAPVKYIKEMMFFKVEESNQKKKK